VPDEKGPQEILFEISRTPSGYNPFLICSGGFRFASTTGYYLQALRADVNSNYQTVAFQT